MHTWPPDGSRCHIGKIPGRQSGNLPLPRLAPFREEDATFFCGREAFTEKLVEAVERTALVDRLY
jgi:hypothetical protein